ncbi:hypothetical protein BKA80DRAFT_257998 [Phyllosticta citrichinensis]
MLPEHLKDLHCPIHALDNLISAFNTQRRFQRMFLAESLTAVLNILTALENSQLGCLGRSRDRGCVAKIVANAILGFCESGVELEPNATYDYNVYKQLAPDLDSELYAIGNSVVIGFSFGTKQWDKNPGGLGMDYCHDIAWGNECFRDLVLDKDKKTLVQALVTQHSSKTFDDIVAKAISEETRKPLYAASAGELGTNPADVDKRLTEVLELARRWGAVLLLDEADVFLQRRSDADIYYKGILVLTTNRIGAFDDAFENQDCISNKRRLVKDLRFASQSYASMNETEPPRQLNAPKLDLYNEPERACFDSPDSRLTLKNDRFHSCMLNQGLDLYLPLLALRNVILQDADDLLRILEPLPDNAQVSCGLIVLLGGFLCLLLSLIHKVPNHSDNMHCFTNLGVVSRSFGGVKVCSYASAAAVSSIACLRL